MISKRLSLFCCFLGFISVASCVPASSGRSARAIDYAAQANKILDETPLVDGWVGKQFKVLQFMFCKYWILQEFQWSLKDRRKPKPQWYISIRAWFICNSIHTGRKYPVSSPVVQAFSGVFRICDVQSFINVCSLSGFCPARERTG